MQKNRGLNFLGRVVDQQKQAPISGAKVLLNFPGTPPVVYTDLEGIYRFTVKPHSNSSIQGKITIEAKGYRSYESSIKLLPDKKDLGDIRLLKSDSEVRTPTLLIESSSSSNSSSSSSSNSSSMLILIIVALMTVLAITVVVFTKRSPPQEVPVEIPVETQKPHVKHHQKHKNNGFYGNNKNLFKVIEKSDVYDSNVMKKLMKPLNYGYTARWQKLSKSDQGIG